MCREAGVKLLYLPPYSPDLNPIEEFFAELKAFIKKQWHEFESSPQLDFGHFSSGVWTWLEGKRIARRVIFDMQV
jgi:transposase